jgi:hypothetical protein
MARAAAASVKARVVVDEITLDGRSVQVENVDLPLADVRLDPRNPRIANTVAVSAMGEGPALQKRIEALLWEDDDVRDLYRQVLINKGLIERIIVRQDGTAVEGNCRTVVYRKLREKYSADANWQRIPARVLPADIGDREIAILLGEMHVAGKNTWTPFEKAGHVYRMHRDFALTQEEIAQRLRMSKSKVNQLIRAFDVMKNRFLPKYPGPGSVRKFSYFEELYKNPTLREWATTTPNAEENFVDWVGKNRLAQGIHVRQLSAILQNPEAVVALTNEGFAEAQRAIAQDNPAMTSKLFKRMLEMTEALKKAQLDDIQKVRGTDSSKARQIVEEMEQALGHFLDLCDMRHK